MAARIVSRQEAYRLGAAALVVAVAVVLAALAFEHLGGYVPCPLCLQQRWAYYAGIPLLFLALVVFSAGGGHIAALLFLAVFLGFLANTGLGIYHAGAEWKFWPGPDTCGGPLQPLGRGGNLLESLGKAQPVVRCDEAPWRFLGMSFAGWNVVLSVVIAVLGLRAALAAKTSRGTKTSLFQIVG
jgi:disulfide bond formation protein DsbB